MKSLQRWTALATALQLILITAVAHSDPKPRNSQPRSPQGCTSKNVALFASPTPSCGSTLQAIVGSQFTLSVKAGDADAGDVVQLGVTGLPAGAKLSTALPASGNPVSTNLTWTPAAGDTGSHVVTFTAWDGCAAGPTQCSFTVNVHASGSCTSTNVALFQSPTPSCGSTLQATAGAPFTLSVKFPAGWDLKPMAAARTKVSWRLSPFDGAASHATRDLPSHCRQWSNGKRPSQLG